MSTINRHGSRRHTVALFALLVCSAFIPALGHAEEEKDQPTKIPATSAAIWQAIDQQTAALDQVIKAGKLDEVHHHAFAIRDLVNALPAKSTTLTAEHLAQVKASGKFVATLANRLDAAGDARNMGDTLTHFQRLKDLLKTIRAHYKGA